MPINSIPEHHLKKANDRLEQWLQQVAVADPVIEKQISREKKEEAQRVLIASDYIFQWAQKYPLWLWQALEMSGDDLSINLKNAKENLKSHLNKALSEFEIKKEVRLFRHQWSLSIATLDILQRNSIEQITYAQSEVANQLILVAYDYLYQTLCQQYGVPRNKDGEAQDLYILAMGKLGGMELNFSSDIDLIFCYPEEGQTDRASKPLENLTFFTRLGQRLVILLSEKTQQGFTYRVDMRLRPYGQSGDLVLSFERMEDYYLEQGREWERFAMIKAAILVSDSANQESLRNSYLKQLENIIKPFSYRRYIDFGVLDSIRQLKQKISSEVMNKNLAMDIKLGEGGIRELEFIVQSYQLISGGRNPQLQIKGWWQALEVLTKLKLIPIEQAQILKEAYQFLRKLENSLQIRQEKQTQQLPNTAEEQSLLAYSMGYQSWQELEPAIAMHRDHVDHYFKSLFRDPNQQTQQDDVFSQAQLVIEQLTREEVDQLALDKTLASHKWQQVNVERISDFKQQYVDKKLGTRGQKRMLLLLPHLLIQAHQNTNPEVVIERTLSVLQGIGRRSAYFEMLAENLPLLNQLIKLVGHSSWLSTQLAIYPSLLDELLFPSSFGEQQSKQTFSNLLQQNLMRIEAGQLEEQLVALANFKQIGLFKVAIGDLNQGFNIQQVSQQLTDIAEVILEYTLNLAWRDLYQKHGGPSGSCIEHISGFQIIGYGKLGGDELGYGSDLDLVFLYEGNPQALTDGEKPIELQQFYTRLAQRLVHFLSARTQQGIMYEVDTRLRPSGRSGLLVSHIESFDKYQRAEAWTWEHQAIVRARPLLGNKTSLQNRLLSAYQGTRFEVLTQSREPLELANQIVEMRQKMRQNLDTSDAQLWNIKQSKGGLVDIEFLTQYWALAYAKKLKALGVSEFPYNNIDWLKLLGQHKFISESTKDSLIEIYRLYRQISNYRVLQMEKNTLEQTELMQQRNDVLAIWDKTFANQNS